MVAQEGRALFAAVQELILFFLEPIDAEMQEILRTDPSHGLKEGEIRERLTRWGKNGKSFF